MVLAPEKTPTYKLKSALAFSGSAAVVQPWRLEAAEPNPISSMIVDDERQFLHWICRTQLEGAGDVLDFGPLAGASTYALVSGLARNPNVPADVKIHSFDLWEFYPDHQRFFPGTALALGDSVFPLWERNLAAFRSRLVPHPGDLLKYKWTGGKIELIFIDAAKNEELNEHIVVEYFPYLIPGKSFVLQQDFISASCPWLHYTMAYFKDNFEILDSPDGGTVAYRFVKKITPEALRGFRKLKRDFRAKARLLEDVSVNFQTWYALEIQMAKAYFLIENCRITAADKILAEVKTSPDFLPHLQFDLNLCAELRHAKVSSASALNPACLLARFQSWINR